MQEIIAALITGGVSVIGAVVALVVSLLNRKKIQSALDSIKSGVDAGGGSFYVVCDKCGNRVYLSSGNILSDIPAEEKK